MHRSQNILIEIGIFSVNHFLFGINADQILELASVKHPEFLTGADLHVPCVFLRYHQQPLPIFNLTHKFHLHQPHAVATFSLSPLTFITMARANMTVGFAAHVEHFASVPLHALKPFPKILASVACRGLWGFYDTPEQLIPLIDLAAVITDQEIAQCQQIMQNISSDFHSR